MVNDINEIQQEQNKSKNLKVCLTSPNQAAYYCKLTELKLLFTAIDFSVGTNVIYVMFYLLNEGKCSKRN